MRAIRAVANVILGNRSGSDGDSSRSGSVGGDGDNGKSRPGAKERSTTSFRVYIHRRNKLTHAWLRINSMTISLEKSKHEVTVWPLQYLRRYGYTSAGIFFFESGRRCESGEGLHCFQSKRADDIFQLVQSLVEENANNCLEEQHHHLEPFGLVSSSRRQSLVSTYGGRVQPLVAVPQPPLPPPPPRDRSSSSSIATTFSLRSRGATSQVRPIPSSVQRFRSEGNASDVLSMDSTSSSTSGLHVDGMGYHSFHRGTNPRLRHIIIPPPPRPRSVGESEGTPDSDDSFGSFQPLRSTSSGRIHAILKDQRIVGNILSERVVSNLPDFRGGNVPSYINISTQEVAGSPSESAATANAAAVVAAAMNSLSHASSSSSMATQVSNRTIHPFWDPKNRTPPPTTPTRPGVAMGTLSRQLQRFTVYTSPVALNATEGTSADPRLVGSGGAAHFGVQPMHEIGGRYVNLSNIDLNQMARSGIAQRQVSCPGEVMAMSARAPSPVQTRASTTSPLPWLNYAHFVPVSPNDGSDSRAPSRCSSIGRSSDTMVNYTQLDVDRTRALKGTLRRSNPA